jgi:hypothetical protein
MPKPVSLILKKALQECAPPIALAFARYILQLAIFHTSGEKPFLKKNSLLKGKGRGRKAFLLATGPSLKSQNLALLQGHDCYSISNFFLHDAIGLLKPKFHFFAPYHPPLVLENYIEWLKAADKSLPEETRIFLGHATRKLVESEGIFHSRDIHYLYLSNPAYFLPMTDITRPVMSPQTGPLMIIPVLFYMEYDEIYLVGCDHNTLRDYKKTISNFYSAERDMRLNVTSSNSWDGIIENHAASYNIFVQYEKYCALARTNGNRPKLINLSSESWLDFVDSMPFESAVNSRHTSPP